MIRLKLEELEKFNRSILTPNSNKIKQNYQLQYSGVVI